MHANIWIRKENKEKWQAIPDKSNWINTLLEASGDTSRYGAVQMSPVGPRVEVLTEDPNAEAVGPIRPPSITAGAELRVNSVNQLVGEIESAQKEAPRYPDNRGTAKDYEICKHNNVKGFCKHGCK